MVIELSDLKSDAQCKFDWNHKFDFRPKLHDAKFNYHFITAILKSQNSVSTKILLIE